jgi:hypothetical protein
MIQCAHRGIMQVFLVKLIVWCGGYGLVGGWRRSSSVSPPRRKMNRARVVLSWLTW